MFKVPFCGDLEHQQCVYERISSLVDLVGP